MQTTDIEQKIKQWVLSCDTYEQLQNCIMIAETLLFRQLTPIESSLALASIQEAVDERHTQICSQKKAPAETSAIS